MQNKQLTAGDIIGLGFMAFAFFLGAGNLIFPPMAGFQAGDNTPYAMVGFLITAVGLPLAGLIAVAKSKGKVMRMLPPVAAMLLASAIYIIIGPAFAAPRAGLVAYDIGIKPFLENSTALIHLGDLALNQAQLLFTLLFFALVMLLALFPGQLMDSVGKFLTPLLIVLLIGLAVSVIVFASGAMPAPTEDYASHPLSKGIVDGYSTMDTLASLMFGMLIIDLLRKKGVDDVTLQTRYLTRAAFIAAAGLAFVYISLFYLGATAGELGKGATTGGQILTNYVNQYFGVYGNLALALVVGLACLTTAVGLVTSCSDFFSELLPGLSYRVLVVTLSIVCAVVANVGLSHLITISIPVLMMVYPVAIALVLVTFLERFFRRPKLTHRVSLLVALFFGIFDGLKVAAKTMKSFDVNDTSALSQAVVDFAAWVAPVMSKFPLYDQGMAWLVPTLVSVLICIIIGHNTRPATTHAQ